MTVLVVATGNPGKLREIQEYFALDSGWELKLKPDELDIEETGTTFLENAALKAAGIAKATGYWAIGDDSGLAVDALGGAPGIFSARYAATDEARIARMLAELGDTQVRSAQFICAIAVADPTGNVVIQAQGVCPGEILRETRGAAGFGYDPIFYVPELGMTFAQMSAAVKHRMSHRGRAFELVMPQLQSLMAQKLS